MNCSNSTSTLAAILLLGGGFSDGNDGGFLGGRDNDLGALVPLLLITGSQRQDDSLISLLAVASLFRGRGRGPTPDSPKPTE